MDDQKSSRVCLCRTAEEETSPFLFRGIWFPSMEVGKSGAENGSSKRRQKIIRSWILAAPNKMGIRRPAESLAAQTEPKEIYIYLLKFNKTIILWFFFFFCQLRVHCAEALGTPIVGDYKYGWYAHKKWKHMPRSDFEPVTGMPYKLRRPEGLDVQKGSVLSKVPLLHLHCRELVLPNIAKFIETLGEKNDDHHPKLSSKPDILRFVAPMPSHMKISWNLMSSYLV